IRTGRPGEAERSFRYAPLASGLDIVRKTLGQHEIATVQTTTVDQASGMVQLSTMLAHASGEWIASDWPVCPIAETANPQRMGAALTYARRYALFTLVGIAGDDDLDAPDLSARSPPGSALSPVVRFPQLGKATGNGRARAKAERRITLDAAQSTEVRDRLLSEMEGLTSIDNATGWARDALAAKNTLTEGDATRVEEAFEQKVSTLVAAESDGDTFAQAQVSESAPAMASLDPSPSGETTLTVAKPRRYRNKQHLRHVARQ